MKNITHYRYERRYPLWDDKYSLELVSFRTVKETSKGYWITASCLGNKNKFVLKESKKRYAYPTKEEALENFIKRTENCVQYAKDNLKHAELFLKTAKEFKIK